VRKGGEGNSDRDAGESVDLQRSMLSDYISQLIIEEERQRKLTKGIKESQEVLGAVVLRMSPEIIMGISNETTISRSRAPSLRIRRPHLPRIG
jgi:hypothetical protein